MGMYRKEWECCDSVTETESYEPERCPFCHRDFLFRRLAGVCKWLEANQPDVFGRGLWDAVNEVDAAREVHNE